MRRDLLIGFIASFAIHFGVAWLGSVKSPPPPKPPAEVENAIQIKMPTIEPDEPEVVEDQQQQQPMDIAPPMQNDVPQQVSVDSFVQPIEPPPPDLSAVSKSVVKIPETRTGFGKGIEVFDISKLDQRPEPRFQARPSYPFEMRRAGISGEVLVDFIVDTNGDVRNASAVHSTQREFEPAAVQAVSRWKFRPGRKNGHPVYTHMQVPIVFTLDENS
jgi:protein TonB